MIRYFVGTQGDMTAHQNIHHPGFVLVELDRIRRCEFRNPGFHPGYALFVIMLFCGEQGSNLGWMEGMVGFTNWSACNLITLQVNTRLLGSNAPH